MGKKKHKSSEALPEQEQSSFWRSTIFYKVRHQKPSWTPVLNRDTVMAPFLPLQLPEESESKTMC